MGKYIWKSIPQIESDSAEPLHVIDGIVPLLSQIPEGCRFAPRCPYAKEKCFKEMPELVQAGENRKVRCWYSE